MNGLWTIKFICVAAGRFSGIYSIKLDFNEKLAIETAIEKIYVSISYLSLLSLVLGFKNLAF